PRPLRRSLVGGGRLGRVATHLATHLAGAGRGGRLSTASLPRRPDPHSRGYHRHAVERTATGGGQRGDARTTPARGRAREQPVTVPASRAGATHAPTAARQRQHLV